MSNIGKITSAMKMVSTAKFKHDEKRFKAGLPFAKPVIDFFERRTFLNAGGRGED